MQLRNKGLTLTEFLITVTIVAVIAGMAWPKFATFAMKSQEKEAFRILDTLRTQQKRFHLAENTFAPVLGGAVDGMTKINAIFHTHIQATGYTVSMSSNALPGSLAQYTVQITSSNGQAWYVTESMPEDIATGVGPVLSAQGMGSGPGFAL